MYSSWSGTSTLLPHCICYFTCFLYFDRRTVMNGLRELDSEAVASRKSRYLKRKLYVNKWERRCIPRKGKTSLPTKKNNWESFLFFHISKSSKSFASSGYNKLVTTILSTTELGTTKWNSNQLVATLFFSNQIPNFQSN